MDNLDLDQLSCQNLVKHLVQLTRKNRYGKEVYAPANDLALLATYLSGTVEVTDWMINVFKRFGCTVEVIAQKETL